MAYARPPKDAKDPFAAAAAAVDAGLRSKSNPVVQERLAREGATTVAASGATVGSELVPAAVGNVTPARGRPPLGLGPWATGRRRRPGARSELSAADAELLAVAWLGTPPSWRRAGWCGIAAAVVARANGYGGKSSARRAAELRAESEAMRADRRWPGIVAMARTVQHRTVRRWIAHRIGERHYTRASLRLLARAILARAALKRPTGASRSAATLAPMPPPSTAPSRAGRATAGTATAPTRPGAEQVDSAEMRRRREQVEGRRAQSRHGTAPRADAAESRRTAPPPV